MLNGTLTANCEQQRENKRFYAEKGNTDNQAVTKQRQNSVFRDLPLSPNHTPVKPKREAD